MHISNSSITFANHCGDFQLTYHELLLCLFQLSERTWYETCTEWGLLPQQNGLSKALKTTLSLET